MGTRVSLRGQSRRSLEDAMEPIRAHFYGGRQFVQVRILLGFLDEPTSFNYGVSMVSSDTRPIGITPLTGTVSCLFCFSWRAVEFDIFTIGSPRRTRGPAENARCL